MILLANLLMAIGVILKIVLKTYFWIVIASAVVSWVNADPYNRIVQVLRSLTEPVYRRVRRVFPFLAAGAIDFAPLAVILGIYFLEFFLVQSLLDFASHLKWKS